MTYNARLHGTLQPKTILSNDGTPSLRGLYFALERYKRYEGSVVWEYHSEYFGHMIERAYHPDGKPCALYRIKIRDAQGDIYLTEINLSGIKQLFKSEVII